MAEAAAKAERLETVYITGGVTHSGSPLLPGEFYEVDAKFAENLYRREAARPAAEVWLERLANLGVTGVGISKDAEPSVKRAAKALKLTVI